MRKRRPPPGEVAHSRAGAGAGAAAGGASAAAETGTAVIIGASANAPGDDGVDCAAPLLRGPVPALLAVTGAAAEARLAVLGAECYMELLWW